MKRFIAVLTVLALMGFTGSAMAASHDISIDFTGFALMALNNSSAITLTVDNTGVNAGEVPAGDSDVTKWLNYTVLTPTASPYEFVGSIDSAMPAGLQLQAVSAAPTGTGGVGTAAAAKNLNATDQIIVSGITSCWTGTGANGANITYTLSVTGAVNAVDATRTVTYTIQAE
jgi:hypothetical protein